MCPEFLRCAHHVGRHRFLYRRQFLEPLAEHPTAADLLLRRVRLVQFQAWCSGQLPGRLLDHHAELLAQRPGVSPGQVHRRLDAHTFKVRAHPPANAPHLGYRSVPQHPVALERIANVDYAAGLRLQSLRGMVRQLGQGLGPGNADADRDACTAQHLPANPAPQRVQTGYAGQIGEGFIDAVDLDAWDHGFDKAHDPLAHVSVQCVVGRERDDAVLFQLLLDLEIGFAHFHKRLGVVAPGNDAAIVVRQDYDRDLG
ncbi:hypothetical protein D3C80_956530 [compost metagenome]